MCTFEESLPVLLPSEVSIKLLSSAKNCMENLASEQLSG